MAFAGIDRAELNPLWATRILSAVMADRRREGLRDASCYDEQRALDITRERLAETSWQQAWKEGAEMTLNEAFDSAVEMATRELDESRPRGLDGFNEPAPAHSLARWASPILTRCALRVGLISDADCSAARNDVEDVPVLAAGGRVAVLVLLAERLDAEAAQQPDDFVAVEGGEVRVVWTSRPGLRADGRRTSRRDGGLARLCATRLRSRPAPEREGRCPSRSGRQPG